LEALEGWRIYEGGRAKENEEGLTEGEWHGEFGVVAELRPRRR
jgi:hypothetical protein